VDVLHPWGSASNIPEGFFLKLKSKGGMEKSIKSYIEAVLGSDRKVKRHERKRRKRAGVMVITLGRNSGGSGEEDASQSSE